MVRLFVAVELPADMRADLVRLRSPLPRANWVSADWPRGSRLALPEANRTSDWKTKRSPTMRTSLRPPRAWRRRPKNSER